MNSLTALKEQVIRRLSAKAGLARCMIAASFPSGRVHPQSPVVAAGVEAVSLSPAGLGGFSEPAACEVTLRLDIFSPGKDGSELHPLCEALLSALLEESGSLGLLKAWCDPPVWEDFAASWRLTVRASLHGALSPSAAIHPAGEPITDITVRSDQNVS